MAKTKRYEVVRNFAGTIGKNRVFFTRRNQADVALMSAADRADAIERGAVREYDADDDVLAAEEPRQVASSVPMDLREEESDTAQATGSRKKKNSD